MTHDEMCGCSRYLHLHIRQSGCRDEPKSLAHRRMLMNLSRDLIIAGETLLRAAKTIDEILELDSPVARLVSTPQLRRVA
jgi:hypothetical protein